MFFGRSDLRIGQSEAKVGAESDFEVRLPAGSPKPLQKLKKHMKKLGKNEFDAKQIKLVPNESRSSKSLIGRKDVV